MSAGGTGSQGEVDRILAESTPVDAVTFLRRLVLALRALLHRRATWLLLLLPLTSCAMLRVTCEPTSETLTWEKAVTERVNDHELRLQTLEGDPDGQSTAAIPY